MNRFFARIGGAAAIGLLIGTTIPFGWTSLVMAMISGFCWSHIVDDYIFYGEN